LWAPLRHARYRRLWIANLLTSLGTGAQAFAAAWLIATISRSASTTAMVQTVTYAPLLLFALLAGVVADAVERPKFLFLANLMMALCACACSIAVLVLDLHATLVPVLVLTFLFGMGTAFRWPAWQASVCDLVSPGELEAVATLENLTSSAGNVAGPALGGMLFAWLGPAAPFIANALSFTGVLALYWVWWQESEPRAATAAPLWPSFRRGLGVALGSRQYRGILAQAAVVYFVLIAFASLLPVYVRDVIGLGSNVFGLLSACLGVGAALAAFLLPAIRARFQKAHVFSGGMVCYGLMLLLITQTNSQAVLVMLIVAGGMAWCGLISTMLAASQALFPAEIRARTLSVYLLVMAGGYTLGSQFWGAIADRAGVTAALSAAGGCLILNAMFVAVRPSNRAVQ
jgi:MFS family permease